MWGEGMKPVLVKVKLILGPEEIPCPWRGGIGNKRAVAAPKSRWAVYAAAVIAVVVVATVHRQACPTLRKINMPVSLYAAV